MISIGFERGMDELEIGGRSEITQTTVMLRSSSILRRVLEIYGNSDSNERPSANDGMKDSQREKNKQTKNKLATHSAQIYKSRMKSSYDDVIYMVD